MLSRLLRTESLPPLFTLPEPGFIFLLTVDRFAMKAMRKAPQARDGLKKGDKLKATSHSECQQYDLLTIPSRRVQPKCIVVQPYSRN